MPTRRNFLQQGVAATAGLVLPAPLHAATPQLAQLQACRASCQFALNPYPETEIWRHGGTMPGSELRRARGPLLKHLCVSESSQASVAHWQAIQIENAADRVAGLTQPAAETGAGFDWLKAT